MLDRISSGPMGHNKPPSPIDLAVVTIDAMNDFMREHPVIDSEEVARDAKLLCDRAKLAFEEIEAERDSLVRPLNEKVSAINAEYKSKHNTDAKRPGTYDRVLIELKARVAAFLFKLEQQRIAAAAEAARIAEEAERKAREAEEAEQAAKGNAAAGEIDVDIVAATQTADESFAEYEKASRFADRAERDTKVKLGGGFGRASSLRSVETLHLESYNRAIKAIGPHPKIEEAILTAAREYRKTHGALPDGVTATTERKL